ncbi:MAG: hypothetical protein J6A96_05330 [Clostridia bacterium]|nr:hypothetical protein [Clostridia bacterium]
MLKLFAKNLELILDFERGVVSSLKIGENECLAGECPVFRAKLRNLDGDCFYIDSTVSKCVSTEGYKITYSNFDNFSSLTIDVMVADGDSISWYVDAYGVPSDYAIEWIEFPKICLPRLIDNCSNGGRILFPYDEGVLLTDETSLPRYEPDFPMSGAHFIFPNKVCAQFISYHFDDIGFYIGAHDPKRAFKGVDFYPSNGGGEMQIRLYSGVGYGESFKTDYPIVYKACTGDWKSAADIYRSWFECNLPAGVKKTSENHSLPDWYKESPLIVTYPVRGTHDMDIMEPNALFPYTNALPIFEKIKNATKCRILALLMHWEGTAPWAPPYVWPPFGGEELFNEFRDKLHANGDLLGVYCSGFGYTKQSTLIESYNCEKRIAEENVLKGVCHSPKNKPELGITCTPYQRYGYDICPASNRGREILDEAYMPLFKSGVDYAQILDQNHGGGQYMCYAREHNHPPMPGEWMTTNMQKLLSEWNNLAPDMLFGCESAASEPFIGNLLMSDNRFELNYPFGEVVPLYAFIYHEYIRNFMGNQCGCPFEPSVDTLRYRLAYSFSIGDIMTLVLAPNGELMSHWGTRDFDHSPSMEKTLKFIKNVMSFYNNEGKKYLYGGKMSACADIKCDTIDIPMQRGRKHAHLPRLLSSSWECEGGKTAYIVVNPEEKPLSFSIDNESYIAPPLDAMLIIK